MQEAIIILVSVSLLDLWCHEIVVPFVLRDYKELSFKNHLKWLIDRKPFNCERCLSFWTGLILSIYFGSIIFLVLPLIVKFKNRL